MDFKEFIKEDIEGYGPGVKITGPGRAAPKPKSDDDDLKKKIQAAIDDAKKTGKAIKRMKRRRSRRIPGSGLIKPLKRLFGL